MRPPIHDHTLWHRLWREGLSEAEIARKSGAHPSTVASWRRYAGLPPNDQRALLPSQERARRKLLAAGLHDSEIARRIGISQQSFRTWRESRGLARNHQRREARP